MSKTVIGCVCQCLRSYAAADTGQCHVRLSSPEHAHQLVRALSKSYGQPAIRGELVIGIPEEAYWEKVPPRLRFPDSAEKDGEKAASEKPARKRARK